MNQNPYYRLPAVILAFLWLGLAGFGATNDWPVYTSLDRPGMLAPHTWEALGPLLFKDSTSTELTSGFRPFFTQFASPDGREYHAHILYPLLNYRRYPDDWSWNLLNLISLSRSHRGEKTNRTNFDIFPLFFYQRAADLTENYFGVMPFGGTVKNRFGMDRFDWVLFPLYGHFVKNEVTTLTIPWPFIKILYGQGNHGFEFWPLFGHREKAGVYRKTYVLWPFFFNDHENLASSTPNTFFAVLPFYAHSRSAVAESKTYVWPFFGYTDSTKPAYHEVRYFWPFFEQTRGRDRYVNRWAPFYSHSIRKGVDKTWILWPFYRHASWNDPTVHQEKTQFLFILYWNLRQTSRTNPHAAPAIKRHIWPLASYWDNGDGRRQLQIFSPLEPLMQDNQIIRTTYSPLFAIYRFSRRGPENYRQEFLFRLLTYDRDPKGFDFNLGPLLGIERQGRQHGFDIAKGLFAFHRDKAGRAHFKFLWFDFSGKSSKVSQPKPTP